MTSRERVVRALNHEEPDRVPLDIGGGSILSLLSRWMVCLVFQAEGVEFPVIVSDKVFP
jgi:hypothetical protein